MFFLGFVSGILIGLLMAIILLVGLIYFKPEVQAIIKKVEQKMRQKGAILDEEIKKDKALKMFDL